MSSTSTKTGGGTSTATATESDGGIAQITSTGGSVTITAPNGPIVNLEVTGGGLFPGFDPLAPPAVGPASAVGTATTAARGDHTHAGVHSVNGALGDVLVNGVATLDTINTSGAELSALPAAALTAGALAWVTSVGAPFRLKQSALAVDHLTVETASGKAGCQWVRIDVENLNWAAQTTWTIDPTNTTGLAGDENSGFNSGAPLLTYSELARRLAFATIRQATAVTVLGDQATTDLAMFTSTVGDGANLIFTFPLTTPLYSGTITTAVTGAAAPSTDNGDTIFDTGVTGGSFTAAGLLATGVLFKRTNGTAAYWWAAADLGTTTLRIMRPCTAAGTAHLALANGDTYSAYATAKLRHVKWSTPQTSLALQFINFNIQVQQGNTKLANINFNHCCQGLGGVLGPGTYNNYCFAAVCGFRSYGSGLTCNLFGGGIKVAAVTVQGAGDFVWNGRITIEGVSGAGALIVNAAFLNVGAGDIAIYDCTAGAGIYCIYWSQLLMLTGAICGNNNTYANGVLTARWFSQLVYTVATLCLSGSFGATPLQVGLNALAVTALPVTLQTDGSGMYRTDVVGAKSFATGGQLVMVAKFSGTIVASAIGATSSYLADSGSALAVANLATPQRYPTSARTVTRLRVVVTALAGTLANNSTATVYQGTGGGAPTATAMLVTIPAGSAVGTVLVDTAHTLTFLDGDTFDVRLGDATDASAGTMSVSATLEGPLS